jgi:hypothetical protein
MGDTFGLHTWLLCINALILMAAAYHNSLYEFRAFYVPRRLVWFKQNEAAILRKVVRSRYYRSFESHPRGERHLTGR